LDLNFRSMLWRCMAIVRKKIAVARRSKPKGIGLISDATVLSRW